MFCVLVGRWGRQVSVTTKRGRVGKRRGGGGRGGLFFCLLSQAPALPLLFLSCLAVEEGGGKRREASPTLARAKNRDG